MDVETFFHASWVKWGEEGTFDITYLGVIPPPNGLRKWKWL
ncbi:hypothetical protein OROMI_002275 [Orobanche minor]